MLILKSKFILCNSLYYLLSDLRPHKLSIFKNTVNIFFFLKALPLYLEMQARTGRSFQFIRILLLVVKCLM